MKRRMIALPASLGLLLMLLSGAAMAQYKLTNLDSNQVTGALHADPLLVNGWGIVHGPGTPWWVSDNNSGWSTLYDGTGKQNQGLKVSIPTAGNGPDLGSGLNGPGSPTGVVFNGNGAFNVTVPGGKPWSSLFLFATLDGTISGWAPQANFNQTVLAVDNSGAGSVFTGLAITNNAKGPNFLFAADMANNKVDIFDSTFTPVNTPGAFSDSVAIPAGFAPFGIRDINAVVYVTFASASGGSGGFVEQFMENGTPVTPGKALVSGAPLNQPWGIAVAPRNFGPLSNALLISNNTNSGTINAFDLTSGQFVGTMRDTNNKTIVINQLWAIDFGDGMGGNGPTNELFFAAGPGNNQAGTFGSIIFK
jgi:uncharacterized protein (TIGR03118 family)